MASVDKSFSIQSEAPSPSAWSPSSHGYHKIFALVNTVSGAKKGWELVRELRKYEITVYNPVDLSLNATVRAKLGRDLLKSARHSLVLIAGGDGTNSWCCSLIEQCLKEAFSAIAWASNHLHDDDSSTEQWRDALPTMVPFPMGTGNDLSRALGWGHIGIAGPKNISDALGDVLFAAQSGARECALDRWRVDYTFDSTNDADDGAGANTPSQSRGFPSAMLCYLSVGYDAQITHCFENERRSRPEKFKSQTRNQSVYVKHGIKHLLRPTRPITESIELVVGGEVVALPENTRSLKLININSAANGIFFWGSAASKTGEFVEKCPPKLDDGVFEVMATSGVSDMLSCRSSLSHAMRLAQCAEVTIRVKKSMAFQVDGEAFVVKAGGSVRVRLRDQMRTMVGYKQPRGVQERFVLKEERDDEKVRKEFKQAMRRRFVGEERGRVSRVRAWINAKR